jgi:hypothetical protein
MTPVQRRQLLDVLDTIQATGGLALNGTAPFTMELGYVDPHSNICKHDGLKIVDAPQHILDAAMSWVHATQGKHEPGEYVTASLSGGALLIR